MAPQASKGRPHPNYDGMVSENEYSGASYSPRCTPIDDELVVDDGVEDDL